jgi:DNA-binding PadR family transcriptional regulator
MPVNVAWLLVNKQLVFPKILVTCTGIEDIRPSPLSLSVLALLFIGPLHPYGIQRLIKLWGKDNVVNVGNRANLYKTIRRLLDAGLISIRVTERDQLYPERTVYQLTDAGRQVAHEWLRGMLGTVRNEFPEFPAALSFASLLEPAALRDTLRRRADQVRGRVAELEENLDSLKETLPRVTLIEDEYQRAVLQAEADWLQGIIEDLDSGALSWSQESLAAAALSDAAADPPS